MTTISKQINGDSIKTLARRYNRLDRQIGLGVMERAWEAFHKWNPATEDQKGDAAGEVYSALWAIAWEVPVLAEKMDEIEDMAGELGFRFELDEDEHVPVPCE